LAEQPSPNVRPCGAFVLAVKCSITEAKVIKARPDLILKGKRDSSMDRKVWSL